MKRLIFILVLCVLPNLVSAQTCASRIMGVGMPAEQAKIVCGHDSSSTHEAAYFSDGTASGNIKFSDNILYFGTSTAHSIILQYSGAQKLVIDSSSLRPYAAGGMSLGTTDVRFNAVRAITVDASTVLRAPSGTDLPATCTVGDIFIDTDDNACADAGSGSGATCVCQATNTWVEVS